MLRQREPMKRHTPLRARPDETRVAVYRKKKCKNPECGETFAPARMGQKACSVACSIVVGRLDAAKAERKKDAVRREKLKTRSDYIKEAQKVANGYARARDKHRGYACVSSGRALDWSGNAVDAGHYRSVGSAPNLRFNLNNINAQSKFDNQFMAGNAVDYRLGLIARRGLEVVERLEADNTPRKHDIEWLKRFTKIFRAKTRRLEKRRGK